METGCFPHPKSSALAVFLELWAMNQKVGGVRDSFKQSQDNDKNKQPSD